VKLPINRTAQGLEAEQVAADHVLAAGWSVLARNFRSKRGEIDLIIGRDQTLVFVEVKKVDAFGRESLASSINGLKQRRIIETSKLYLARHREYTYKSIRYDVIAIRAMQVEWWLESAFAE